MAAALKLGAERIIVLLSPLCPVRVSAASFLGSAGLIDRAAVSTRTWLENGGLRSREVPQQLGPHEHRGAPANPDARA